MFLTAVVSSFIAGLSCTSGYNAIFTSINSGTMIEIDVTIPIEDLEGDNWFQVWYSYTDSSTGNAYTTNILHFYIDANDDYSVVEYVYGWNSTVNNCAFSGYTYVSGHGDAMARIPYTVEYYSDESYDVINMASEWQSRQVIPSQDYINLEFYITLLSYNDYVAISGQDIDASSIYDNGYQVGKSEGAEIGYREGFAEAKEIYENQSGQINSIFNGILSIGLIPLEFLMSIFNFEILGVNVTSIITAILSIMVIIILLRIVLGGKASGKD